VDQPFQYFVGIDWGTQTHRVAVLCDEVGDLGERLCGGDPHAGWDTNPALNALAQLPRKRLYFPFAELAQV